MGETNLNPSRQSWQQRLVGYAPYIFFGLLFIILPTFLPSYLQAMVTKFLIFAIFAMSLDLIFGYTGLWSLGHAAYFGMASYTFGILVCRYGVESFWLAALTGILAAVILAAFFGIFALRVSGLYFMMVTFALGMLLYTIAVGWFDMTGGLGGLFIPRTDFGIPWFTWHPTHIYYLALAVFAISFFILHRIVNSPFGRALQGIRDDEHRMRHLGYNTWLHKYIAFIVAGLFAGIAGILYISFKMVLVPEQIGFITSILAMLYVIIGGTGTLFGGVIGAAMIISVEFGASLYTPERWPLILGGVYVIVIMFLPNGVAPYLLKLWNKVKVRYGYGSS